MTYFADLSEYEYFLHDAGEPRALNVGWLEASVAFPTAAPDSDLLDLLWKLCSVTVKQTRGLHECPFCAKQHRSVFSHGGEKRMLGAGEIRVFAPDGKVYAAPNLIHHYVAAHRYRPPDPFITAVKEGPLPPSEAYFERLRPAKLEWREQELLERAPVAFKFVKTATGVQRVDIPEDDDC
jgi:hypothetical protein